MLVHDSWHEYSINSRNDAAPFFDIIKQRDHKYATQSWSKQFYVFLATAPTGVLTAGTAGLLWKAHLWERCGTFMEKRRRCTIAGLTVYQRTIDDKKNKVSTFKPLEQNVLSKDKYTGKASYNFACRYKGMQVDGVCCIPYTCSQIYFIW